MAKPILPRIPAALLPRGVSSTRRATGGAGDPTVEDLGLAGDNLTPREYQVNTYRYRFAMMYARRTADRYGDAGNDVSQVRRGRRLAYMWKQAGVNEHDLALMVNTDFEEAMEIASQHGTQVNLDRAAGRQVPASAVMFFYRA